MLEKFRDSINKYQMLKKGDTVLIGVSGGPDSTALTYLMKELEEEYDLKLHIFHLNHQLRGEEAEGDALFVEDLARSLGLPVTIESCDVAAYIAKEKLSLQEGARVIRYRLMEKKAREIKAGKIAIGQNADDQAETVLMRFLRGAGARGLSGILPVRDGKFIRPMLELWREEIEEYLFLNNRKFRTDKSNFKTIYLRNKIRLDLLPSIKQEYNPNISKVLVQMSNVFREENSYLEQCARELLEELIINNSADGIEIDKVGFLRQHLALQRRMLTMLWENTTKVAKGLSFIHIEQGLAHISKGKVGTRFNLPKDLWLVNNYETFLFGTLPEEAGITSFCYPIAVPGITRLEENSLCIETEVLSVRGEEEKSNRVSVGDVINLDYDLLADKKLFLRNRQPGDRFKPLRGTGSKKLKNYFIDLKIPQQARDKIPLVATEDQLLWVIGHTINDAFKVTSETKNILRIKLDKN